MKNYFSYFSILFLLTITFIPSSFAAQKESTEQTEAGAEAKPTQRELSPEEFLLVPLTLHFPDLHLLINENNKTTVEEALKNGPLDDLLRFTRAGDSTLHLAAGLGNLDILMLLIEAYKKLGMTKKALHIFKKENKAGKTALAIAEEKEFKAISTNLQLAQEYFENLYAPEQATEKRKRKRY